MRNDYQAEYNFWSTYGSHLCETYKQKEYAINAGITFVNGEEYPFRIDLNGKSVLEIGAGPCGLTLRCLNGRRKVIEPLDYPQWVWDRYSFFGVEFDKCRAEDMHEEGWDEVWLFNVMQHVDFPELVMQKVINSANTLRIFEWLDIPTDEFHEHSFTKEWYDWWLCASSEDSVKRIDKQWFYAANAYFGVYNLAQLHKVKFVLFGNGYFEMVNYLLSKYGNKPLIGAEIGVWAGVSAEYKLDRLNIKQLYLIDPYVKWSECDNQNEIDNAFSSAKPRLAKYSDKITWVKCTSDEAYKFLSSINEHLDFVYIDGDHSFDGCFNDITNYFNLTNVIGGHDFVNSDGYLAWKNFNKNRDVKMGVSDAVARFARVNKINKIFTADFSYADWWIDKDDC